MIINTKRLAITKFTKEEWLDLLDICNDFEASPYKIYDFPMPTDKKGVQELAERWENSGSFFAVRVHDSSEMIGYVCYHKNDETYDIGFAFKAIHQNKGYAYEAANEFIKYLNKEMNVKTFTAGLGLGNLPSYHLIKKLGFKLISTEEISFRVDELGNKISFEGGNFELSFE